MPLQLKIVSNNQDLLGDDAERVYDEVGGSIGRSLGSDWTLPDPDRYVSGHHASIDYKGGIYYVLDHSSNGVYINDDIEPIGNGNPRRLFDGDYIRMGDFEFVVSVSAGESLAVPLDSETPLREVAADNSRQYVDEDSQRTHVNLLDEEEITGDAAFQRALFGKASREHVDANAQLAGATSQPASATSQPTGAANDAESVDTARPLPTAGESVPAAEDEIFNAFLDGLCIDISEIHPSTDRAEMMKTAGSTMRELIFGIISLLTSRSNLKNAFNLDQTTVLPRQNNPLKFSKNTDDLLMQLLLGTEGDYLGASDAIREVYQDLLFHQNAIVEAMNSAFIEFADRFDPAELTENFERTMSGSRLFAFMKKSQFWDLYCSLYPIMTEKGGGRFPQMFGEEFVRAYERQVAEYRRNERETAPAPIAPAIDPGLAETRRLEPADRVNPVRRANGAGAGQSGSDVPTHEPTINIHPLGKREA